ncbi:class I SAM-dependent methyltransferase [Aestuariivirga sp.]|uniref:class I SAM-dependent methyltransferase n=1 Tax=Aestuariivirga sp. TaxID=2650926 RepID=UPI003592F68C
MSAHEPIDGVGYASNRLDMDRMYRFQRHIYDASRRFYLLGRDRLIADLKVPAGGSVLEIGCGTGRNLVKAARAYPDARLFGFDISDEMLKTAASAIWKAGLTDRVRIAQGDALAADPLVMFGERSFDRIYFSYALSMIPRWSAALSHALDLLSPQGELHIVDFGQCENLPHGAKALLFRWLRRFDVEPRAAIHPAVVQLASQSGRPCSFASGFRGYSWHLCVGASRNGVHHCRGDAGEAT